VYSYNDFVEHKSENAVKAAGKYKQQGKNYVVQDGDIIFFKVIISSFFNDFNWNIDIKSLIFRPILVLV
jgi:hypothetical protein